MKDLLADPGHAAGRHCWQQLPRCLEWVGPARELNQLRDSPKWLETQTGPEWFVPLQDLLEPPVSTSLMCGRREACEQTRTSSSLAVFGLLEQLHARARRQH